MMKSKLALLAATIGAAGLWSASAQAQAVGVATADPAAAIGDAKAFATANQQIATTYKTQLDQADARRAALQRQLEPLYTALDTNKDKNLSQDEVEAARAAKRPEVAQIETAQNAANTEIARLTTPAITAQAYALETISSRYDAAVQTVTTARRVGLIVSPDSVLFAGAGADLTPAITAEIDRVLPSVSVVVPAGWQPNRSTIALQRQLQQIAAARAQQQAAQGPAPAAPAPAAPAPAAPARGRDSGGR